MWCVEQVTPLLADLRGGNLVGNLEALTRSAADAAADIHQLQNQVRTPPLFIVQFIAIDIIPIFKSSVDGSQWLLTNCLTDLEGADSRKCGCAAGVSADADEDTAAH